MNSREQAQVDMIKRVVLFGTNYLSKITTPVAPKETLLAGQTQAKQFFDDLTTDETGLVDRLPTPRRRNKAAGDGAGRHDFEGDVSR